MPLPTLLMLPGTLCDQRIFAAQRRHLRSRANLIVASYQDMKEREVWLRTLLREMPQKFYVAGFSLGGLLALELLRLAGDRVQGVALISSNAQAASHAAKRKSTCLRRLWIDRGPGEVARRIKTTYFHHDSKRRRFERLVFDMAVRTPRRSAFEEFSFASQRASGLTILGDFEGSVLVVSGKQDRLCPPEWQMAMKDAKPQLQWLQIDRCGHFLPLEAPSQLGYALQAWICESNQPLGQLESTQSAINSGVTK